MVIDGIEVNVTAADLDDFEVLECLAVMMDEETADRDRMVTIPKLFRLVFKEDWPRVKRELREQHDGRLTSEMVMDFFTHLTNELNAKNS